MLARTRQDACDLHISWSGRRDSNPRPSPWQGDALPTELLPLGTATTEIVSVGGAESQNRTGDTAIFSRVLYQLSYLGPMANQAGRPSATGRIPCGFAALQTSHGPRAVIRRLGFQAPHRAPRVSQGP